jgi:YggT family protein
MVLVAQLIDILYWILVVFIFARFIFSWVRPDPYSPIWGPLMRITYQVTEPLLSPIRRVLPGMGGLDFSPIILLFGLNILRGLLLNIVL